MRRLRAAVAYCGTGTPASTACTRAAFGGRWPSRQQPTTSDADERQDLRPEHLPWNYANDDGPVAVPLAADVSERRPTSALGQERNKAINDDLPKRVLQVTHVLGRELICGATRLTAISATHGFLPADFEGLGSLKGGRTDWRAIVLLPTDILT